MKHYRRFFALMLAGVLLLGCAGCGGRPSGDDPTTGTTGPEPISSLGEDATAAPTVSTAPGSKGRPDIAMNHEVEKDGLVLRVYSGYQHQYTDEPFTLTASITNNTGRDIPYTLPSCTPDMHLEIRVRIDGPNNAEFIDMDTYGKGMDLGMKTAVLKAGETFTETIRFLPGQPRGDYQSALSKQEIDWFPAGEYKGTALFTWYTGTGENPGEAKQLQLEFPVVLI